MKITPKITGTEAVRNMLKQIGEQSTKNALAATAEELELFVEGEAAKHERGDKSNKHLTKSLTKRRTPDGWVVAHDPRVAPEALFVHWGTRPHKIKPNKKKALRWPAAIGFNFAKGVDHPGYKGDAWMVRAAALAPRMFAEHVAKRLKGGG